MLLHSDGVIDHNTIQENKIGLAIAEETVSRIKNNLVEKNDVYGIEIEKTSQCTLENNEVKNNHF